MLAYLEFAGCANFSGPHSIDCIAAIWADEHCIWQGRSFPGNLRANEYLATFGNKNLL